MKRYLAFHHNFDSAAVVVVEAESDTDAKVRAHGIATTAGVAVCIEDWHAWPLDSLPSAWCFPVFGQPGIMAA
jgi:hypothetical protein